MSAPSVRRRRLGAELRRLREGRGVKGVDAARHIGEGWDGPRVSRLEGGKLGIKPAELVSLLDFYEVTDAARRDILLALARDGARRGWWQTYREVISPAYAELIALEADASSLRSYQTLLVPGLLQTAAYARASIAAINMNSTAEAVNALVEVRMARQSVLARPNPLEVWAIIHEAALRPTFASPQIMNDQLQRLLDLVELPHVSIQIIPLDAPPHPGMAGPYTVLGMPESADLDVVLVEHVASALYVEDPVDVAVYNAVFGHLRAHALPLATSADLIARMKKEHRP
ncbi:helix-turn-helix domain-containing protein [Streptomyces sp. NPDC048603]|uniref:helix-turn-helix domain-containing protein n=1 Tax=Streptomyces sp. NPDC048603 TaxID=3365577 RepID=UPI0037224AAF